MCHSLFPKPEIKSLAATIFFCPLMARKNTLVSLAAVASSSRRPTTATELSSITNLNIHRNSEAVELRKQWQLIAMLTSNYSNVVVTIATLPTPLASELKAGVETAAEKKSSMH
ncbi:hypothetical protein KSP39_PZI009831 [Platanthera zijinensis]|uniref:Uncharacterized protein n=1 Tax=Platanthera zijinensis TaxID=2320716 RepID=A0AAP0G718_9ASPA